MSRLLDGHRDVAVAQARQACPHSVALRTLASFQESDVVGVEEVHLSASGLWALRVGATPDTCGPVSSPARARGRRRTFRRYAPTMGPGAYRLPQPSTGAARLPLRGWRL